MPRDSKYPPTNPEERFADTPFGFFCLLIFAAIVFFLTFGGLLCGCTTAQKSQLQSAGKTFVGNLINHLEDAAVKEEDEILTKF